MRLLRTAALAFAALLAAVCPAFAGVTVDASTTGNSGASAVSTHPITIPACASGKMLVVSFARNGDGTVTNTWPGSPSYTALLAPTTCANGNCTLEIRTRVTDGSEADFDITTSVAEKDAWRVDCVSGQHASTAPEVTGANPNVTVNNPDPPSETASWGGSESNLWITMTTYRTSATTLNSVPTSCPTNYETAACLDTKSTGTGRMGLGSSWRVAATDTEDPDTFLLDATTSNYVAATVVIRAAPSTQAPRSMHQYRLRR